MSSLNKPMQSHDPVPDATAIIESIRAMNSEELSEEQIWMLMGAAVRHYAAHALEAYQQGLPLPRPFSPEDEIAATDAMLVTTAIMKAVNVQLFELGMFQSWAGR